MYGTLLGTLVGGAVALIVGWPLEALIFSGLVGALLGHRLVDQRPPQLVDRSFRSSRRAVQPKPAPGLAETLSPVLIELARIDGPVSREEVRAIKQYFEETLAFDDTALEAGRLALKRTLTEPIRAITDRISAEKLTLVDQPGLLRALYALALADGPLKRSEHEALVALTAQLTLSAAQAQDIRSDAFGDEGPALRALGLQTGASNDEIRAAFRRRAAEAHPDRAGPRSAATFRAVKDAYESLRQVRGF